MQVKSSGDVPDSAVKKRFMGGVMILTLSTLVCKVIGLLFKIPMLRYIGIDGMAYFTSAYHIYLLINTISTAGLPVAVSMLVSRSRVRGNRRNIRRIFIVSLIVFLILGTAGMCLLYFTSGSYSDAIGIPDAAPAVAAIAPTLFFICISSAIRGYFQGHEIMAPTAVSQLIESAGKLGLGIGFASAALAAGAGAPDAAAAAISGLTAGVGISMLYLIVRMTVFDRRPVTVSYPLGGDRAEKVSSLLSQLFRIALPVTLSASVTSITGLADTVLITNRLVDAGYSSDMARMMYSSYTNLAVPLFNLPPALITPLAISLVPALTASIASGNREREKNVFDSSFRLCVFFALPAAAGLSVFSRPILSMVFPAEAEAVGVAAPLLSVLAVSIVFSCMMTVSNAVLQAYGRPALPIISMAAGAAVKIAVEYISVATPLGITGAPVSTFACTVTVMILNIVFISRCSPHSVGMKMIWRSLAATAVSIAAALGVYALLLPFSGGVALPVLAAIVTAAVLYMVTALKFRAVTSADLDFIPGGAAAGRVLKKLRLISD